MDVYCIKLAGFEKLRCVSMKLEQEIDAKIYKASLSNSKTKINKLLMPQFVLKLVIIYGCLFY
jgi:hypothetical protein